MAITVPLPEEVHLMTEELHLPEDGVFLWQ
jgi:hypothetical protein